GLIVEVRNVDDESVAVPVADRITVPEVDALEVRVSFQVDGAVVVNVLVEDRDILRRLDDLKWEWQIGQTRHTRLEALPQRIRGAVLNVRAPSGKRRWLIWNHPAGWIDDDAQSCGDAPGCRMRLEIPRGRRVQRLPDALQIR